MKIKKFWESKVPVVVVGSLVMLFFLYKNIEGYYQLNNYGVYGVGKAIGVSKSGSASYLDYVFYFNNQKYESNSYLGDHCGKCKIGKYFKIKFSSQKPGYSNIFFKIEIINESIIKKAGFILE